MSSHYVLAVKTVIKSGLKQPTCENELDWIKIITVFDFMSFN